MRQFTLPRACLHFLKEANEPALMLGITFPRRSYFMVTLDSPVSSGSAFLCLLYPNQCSPRFTNPRRAAMSCPYSTASGGGRRRFPRLMPKLWANRALSCSSWLHSKGPAEAKYAAHEKVNSLGLMPIFFGEPWTGPSRVPAQNMSVRSRPVVPPKVKLPGLISILYGEPWSGSL